jgi:selenide,water dikinase
MPTMTDPNLLVGLETGDDAAIYKLNEDLGLIFTLDFFPPVVDDPFSYGAVAAANSLSDIYAMGGTPLMALNIVGFPANLPKEILQEIMRGGYTKAQEAGCLIVGGHTVDDQEPKYGLAVIGLVTPGKELTNAGAKAGDVLILTKPLGTGIITTAGKQGTVSQAVLDRAVEIMSTLNAAAARAMVKVGANAATDITGFGFLGHLKSMMLGSNTQARINLSQVPAIDGVWQLIDDGVAPGGTHRNLSSVNDSVIWGPNIARREKLFLCDAQTSGGLLMSVDREKANEMLQELKSAGVPSPVVVGDVMVKGPKPLEVLA